MITICIHGYYNLLETTCLNIRPACCPLKLNEQLFAHASMHPPPHHSPEFQLPTHPVLGIQVSTNSH